MLGLGRTHLGSARVDVSDPDLRRRSWRPVVRLRGHNAGHDEISRPIHPVAEMADGVGGRGGDAGGGAGVLA